ncbi:MAG: GNAT family N-acetyltransferase [Gemmatimonadetes bacterium]|nr:GNAT family N-acetyltransferase [Gemmatimonadota bacterium]
MPTIRPVREADAPAIAELLNEIVRAGVHSVMTGTFSASDQAEFIRTLPERAVYLAAFRNGELLGTQDVLPARDPDEGEISTFIAEPARRTGVGSRLVEATLEAVRAQDYRRIQAIIRADNAPALSFYEHHGFVRSGVVSPYAEVGGRQIDGIRCVRMLLQPTPGTGKMRR